MPNSRQKLETGRKLNGWGEIAHYLDVGIRTAQGYEQDHALPIHRMPGTKGRVWAFVDELDHWKTQAGAAPGQPVEAAATLVPHGPETVSVGGRSIAKRLLLLGVVLVLVIGALWASLITSPPVADFQVQGRNLIAIDKKGRELWRYRFPWDLVEVDYTEGRRTHHSWLGRLNSAGDPHLILSVMPSQQMRFGKAWPSIA